MPSVKDIMTKIVITVGVDSSVSEAAELMNSKEIGSLVIVQGEAQLDDYRTGHRAENRRQKTALRN